MHVVEMIYFWARAVPDRPAILQPEMITTFQGLADGIESIGERIDRLNLDKREPVAVSLANPSFLLATIFALMRAGYSVAPVTPPLYQHFRPAGIRNLIYDTQGQMLSGGRNIRFDMSWLPTTGPDAVKRSYRKRATPDVDMVFFTSGTTGLPKKIVQAGKALEQLLNYPFTCASGAHEKILILPGLTSTFGFNRACEVLNVGKTACFAPDTESALSVIGLFGVDLVVASASQALALADVKRKQPEYQLDSLQAMLVGGGKIGPEGIAGIRAALCRNFLWQYGSTEGGVVALTPFQLIADIPGAVGFVLPWAELEIVDESGQPLPPGAEGLIRYRTPQLLENQKVTGGSSGQASAQDQWFYPGDIGSVTAEGILCLAGRTSDVINRGGVKVSGTRIEEILQALPEIKEAAACGVAGSSGLEEVWIAVVADGIADVEKIKQHLSEHSDVRIAPDEVFVFDQLPRGELGKVQKYRLKELMLDRKRGG
jgi:acyl-coenzyme A synthetase/AMP-(fatty) acid ligase